MNPFRKGLEGVGTLLGILLLAALTVGVALAPLAVLAFVVALAVRWAIQ